MIRQKTNIRLVKRLIFGFFGRILVKRPMTGLFWQDWWVAKRLIFGLFGQILVKTLMTGLFKTRLMIGEKTNDWGKD